MRSKLAATALATPGAADAERGGSVQPASAMKTKKTSWPDSTLTLNITGAFAA